MRDCLFAIIALGCAQCPGVSVNMKVKEFLRAKQLDINHFEIEVWDHKTVLYHGAARIVLTQVEFDKLKLFVEKVLNMLRYRKSDRIFLSWRRNRMASGGVSKRLHNLWEKCGNFDNKKPIKNLTAGAFRRSASTGVRLQESLHKKEVAALMNHSKQTADTHYDIIDKRKAALIGSKKVRKTFHSVKMPNKIQVQPNFFIASPIKQAINIIKTETYTTPVKTTQNKFESRYHSNSLLRKQWSSQDTNVLQQNCMTPLKELAKSVNASPKQIYDKIRALKQKVRSA